MRNTVLLMCLVCSLLFSCANKPAEEKKVVVPEKVESSSQKATSRTHLCIYLYGDFPQEELNRLQKDLALVFDKVESKGRLDFPVEAWYAPRKRYRAPKLLDYQAKLFSCKAPERGKSEYILGVTTKDISLKYKEYEDWGVMGLSYQNKGVTVISTFRLGGVQKMNKESFKKLALHELGHSAGLPHCNRSKTCIMRDAKGKDHFPELTEFCPSCKSYLQKKGWNLCKHSLESPF